MHTENPKRAIPRASHYTSSNKPRLGCRKNKFIERVRADAVVILKHSGVNIMPPVIVVEECDRIRDLLFRKIRDLQRANEIPVEKSLELNVTGVAAHIANGDP